MGARSIGAGAHPGPAVATVADARRRRLRRAGTFRRPLWRAGRHLRILGRHTRRRSASGVAMAEPGTQCPIPRAPEREREGTVKPFPAAEPEIGDASFTDLIACERDCRTCSYAAWLDCDGDCGPCPHNGYCPCVNPVVARSKTALKIIELRPMLLQDLRGEPQLEPRRRWSRPSATSSPAIHATSGRL